MIVLKDKNQRTTEKQNAIYFFYVKLVDFNSHRKEKKSSLKYNYD